MKCLLFDYRDMEQPFFENRELSDFDITFYKNNLTEKTELTDEEYDNTEILSVFIHSQINERVINKFKNLRMIVTRSTGYNHIDIDACREKNIAVINVEKYGEETVAQYTIGMLIALVRNIVPAMKDFGVKTIGHSKYVGHNLHQLSLGVIGTGSIGVAVCKIANSLGMHIFAHDLSVNPEIKDFVEYVSLDELYKYSNVISLHLPYSKENYHMISEKEFEQMQDGSYLINCARGELVDNFALYKAIKSGKIAGAGLDVLECEKYTMYDDDEFLTLKDDNCNCLENMVIVQKLLKEPNVIITPHIAYNTHQSINRILESSFNSIKDCVSGRCTNQVV